ncbi:hypothetical protein [Streptomyces sp. NPDC006551]|uniref:hypothetical protein n=1 Tax=Streptomyces sp. NPDC006551 TaxID=3157178 RepID=UPI0033A4AAA1
MVREIRPAPRTIAVQSTALVLLAIAIEVMADGAPSAGEAPHCVLSGAESAALPSGSPSPFSSKV